MTRPAAGALARHLVLLVAASLVLAPFLVALSISLRAPGEMFAVSRPWIPSAAAALRNYRVALQASPLLRFVLNGAITCALVVACQLAVMIPCAYALAKLEFPGRRRLFALMLVALVVPAPVLSIPHFLMVTRLGLVDSYPGLAFPWMLSAFGVFQLRQLYLRIPTALVDAARLDGLGEAEILLRIMLPLSWPVLGAFSIYSFVLHWNDLFWPSVVTRSESMATPPYGVMLFQSQDAGSDFGALMAGMLLVSAPMIAAFALARRRFLDAVTFGVRT